MRRLLRFFLVGPGAILTVIFIGLGVCWLIKSGQDKQKAEAKKHQVQRELGKIKPSDDVDKSEASKEVTLSTRRLSPVPGTQPTLTPAPAIEQHAVARPQALPSLVSFYSQAALPPAPTPTPVPERPKDPTYWLPPGTFIPCALVNTVESSHINTPVVAEVIREVYQGGHLIIPAGAIVSSFAQSGAVRDRIEVAGTWLIVYPDGR